MIPNKKEKEIIKFLEINDVKNYDFLKENLKNMNLSYSLNNFIDLLKKYPYHFGTGNPKCCEYDINMIRDISLKMALEKIPSFYKIGYVGMNICMAMEDINYHNKIKSFLDILFESFWNWGTNSKKREIKNAIICHGSISDISIPLFYFIWTNNFLDYKKYLEVAKEELNKLTNKGYLDHFLMKIVKCLICMKQDGREIKEWILLLKKDFDWKKYDIENYINLFLKYTEEKTKNPDCNIFKICFNYINILQKLINCKIPYYLRIPFIDELILILKYYSPFFKKELHQLEKMKNDNIQFFIYKETKEQYLKKEKEENQKLKSFLERERNVK